MKHGWLRVLVLAVAAALCAGMVLYSGGKPQASVESLTLWYMESDCPPEIMEGLVNRCLKESGVYVETASFADEASLGAAFLEGQPDLLFCGHLRATQMDARGKLLKLSDPLPAPEALKALRPTVGSVFFPLGSRLPILLVNTALTQAELDTPEALLETVTAVNEVSPLLYLALEGQMTGTAADEQDPKWRDAYNALAEAVFRHSLIPVEADAAAYAAEGLLPCAVTPSTVLSTLTDKTIEPRLLPLPQGVARYPAELMGFVLLEGADQAAGEAFLRWFDGARMTETALSLGLVPIVQSYTGSGANSATGRLLLPLAENGALYWPDADEPFFQNREACELRLREILDLLI